MTIVREAIISGQHVLLFPDDIDSQSLPKFSKCPMSEEMHTFTRPHGYTQYILLKNRAF